jgi:sulfoxide reductase catalytic subunit YedY
LSQLFTMIYQEYLFRRIQGWTAIGEWGGVPMSYIISLCRPLPQARYVVYYSYQYTKEAQFYEAIDIEPAKHYQTILTPMPLWDEPLKINAVKLY